MFLFPDNCIWIGSWKFLQSWTGYFPLVVNVLTNTPKTSPNTRRHIFQSNFAENEKKTWEKHSHEEFASIWEAFICLLWKRRFLESGLTKSFTVCNLGHTLVLANIFSFKMFKIRRSFQKWNRKLRKSFSFFR